MNNFRRRASAKKQRTVLYHTSEISNVSFSNINIVNGTFTIGKNNGDTASLLITADYFITYVGVVYYDDGTHEYDGNDPDPDDGTCSFTQAMTLVDDWFNPLVIETTIRGETVRILQGKYNPNLSYLDLPWSGGEVDNDYCYIHHYGTPMYYGLYGDIDVHVVDQGNNFAVTITKM